MRFEVLGPVRVCQRTGAMSMSGRLRQSLLALLLAHADTRVPVDMLLDALWGGERDPRSAQKLQLLVHKLRKSLDEPERLVFDAGGYRLRVLPGELDAERFDGLVTEAGNTGDPHRRVELLREGLGLWRGAPYQGVDLVALTSDVQRLGERRLAALEALFTAELGCQRHATVVAELTELVGQHPLRERLHGLLMTALYRSGRQAEALAVYRDARRMLLDELGLEPGPELREIERRILAGEPVALDPQASPEFPHPAQLPLDVHGFVGREPEIAELDRMVASDEQPMPEAEVPTRIVAITGTAGVGKTALATHWAYRNQDRFPDGQLYVDLRGYGPGDPVAVLDALAGLLRSLGVDGADIPPEPTERAARLRTLLASRRMLVVLDNAATTEQVRPLLPGTSPNLTIITSRDALAGLAVKEGAHRIDLDRMTVGEAEDLLTGLLGHRTADAVATAQLIERCARLPLALRVAAERIRQRRGSSVADLLAELSDEQERLDLLDTGDPHTSVRAVLSWSYRHLTPEAARLFRLLGMHPGRDIDTYALAALLGTRQVRPTRRLIDTLVRANLIDETAPGRYQQHDLLRAYAAELAEEDEDRQAALTRLFDYYLYSASLAMDRYAPHERARRPEVDSSGCAAPDLPDRPSAAAWLEAERANLVATARLAASVGRLDHTGKQSAVLFRYLDTIGDYDHAHVLHELATRTADPAHRASALNDLGVVYGQSGRYPEAADYFRQALACASSGADGANQLRALGNLGLIHLRLREYPLALRRLTQASTITGQRHDREAEQSADTVNTTGDAVELVRAALAVARKIRHRPCVIEALNELGGILRDRGATTEALDTHREALALAEQLGNRDLKARAHDGIARAHATLGDIDAARPHWWEALAIYRHLGIPEANEVRARLES